MSDPVSNVEIEDVLSSIRRLVSNGKQDRFALAEPMDVPKDETANRLVLTPSLRVDEGQSADQSGIAPPEDAPHQIMSEPEEVAEGQIDSHDEARDPEAQIEVGTATVERAEADTGDGGPQNDDQDWSVRDDETPEEQSNDEQAHADEPSEPHHAATDPEGEIWLEATETTSEAVAEETMQEDDSEALSADHDQADPDTGTANESNPGDHDAAPSDLEAQAAEFEAAIASRDDQWEPDGDSSDDYAGSRVTSLSWRDSRDSANEPEEEELSIDPDWAEADDLASARHAQSWAQEAMPVPPVEEWGDDGGLSLDDAVLDEEALRDMVSEIVRQELQGALGERITRNVRKLVRREIHRALASQDMD